MPLILGAIADDLTGATDLANTLVGQGMRTALVVGPPEQGTEIEDAEAVVVALKTRTSPVEQAVSRSLAAVRWLQSRGVRQVVFKYCSTFDSTPEGNIGPVADALMDALDAPLAVVCPAFPGNGRTVYKGHLFVGDRLLSDSPMRDHPLTPMRESDLVKLMSAQTPRAVGLVDFATIGNGVAAVARAFDDLRGNGVAYAVTDALTEDHLRVIGRAAAGHRLVSGGSGIALGLPDNFRDSGQLDGWAEPAPVTAAGRSAVLAGSCSQATRGQIAHACVRWPHLKLDVGRIADGQPVVEDALSWARANRDRGPLLIYSSADPEEVESVLTGFGNARIGEMIEETLGRIAAGLVDQGIGRIVVAGGETSGAVVSHLGIRGLRIGPEIEPGVPWTETLDEPKLALALKSGNFGGQDFFVKAMEMLR